MLVELPLGTEARNTPLLVCKSTSTVGIPLLSRICLALIFVMTDCTAFLMWFDCGHRKNACWEIPMRETGKKNEKRWWEVERYDEENGIGGFGPNGGIDGIFEFSGKHVLIQVILHWHFHNQLRLLLLSKFSLTAEKMCVRSVLLLLGKRDSTLMLLLLPSVAETRKPLLLNVVVFLNEWINLILFISFSFIPLKYNSNI